MNNIKDASYFESYQMGLNLRRWLGLAARDDGIALDQNNLAELDRLCLSSSDEAKTFDSQENFLNVVEELVGMKCIQAAYSIWSLNRPLHDTTDFRFALSSGNMFYMLRKFDEAEKFFRNAQACVAEEPAPYVNLVQTFIQTEDVESAHIWSLAGLDVETNHPRLWELLAQVLYVKFPSNYKAHVQSEAQKRKSWLGLSFAADLLSPDDPEYKNQQLSPLWESGERDPRFLIEYTAHLGGLGQYQNIIDIVDQFWNESEEQKIEVEAWPWQLSLHKLQAFMGMSRDKEAELYVQEAKQKIGEHLPPEAMELLLLHEKELRSQQN